MCWRAAGVAAVVSFVFSAAVLAQQEPSENDLCLAAGTVRPAGAGAAVWGAGLREGKWFVQDGMLAQRIAEEGHRLIDQRRATTMPVLIGQLKSAKCSVRLAPVSRGRMSAEEIYRERIRSVLMVGSVYKCPRCANWHASAAGGFVIGGSGEFVTNYHVVKKEWGSGQAMVVMTPEGHVLPVVRVLAANEKEDVAICQADVRGEKLMPVAISTVAPVGSGVTVISHPESRWYTLSQGVVCRYYMEGHADGSAARRVAISADFAKGSSGGAIFNEFGDVVGMVASTSSVYYDIRQGQPANLQMVFKQCVPAEAILSLIGE